MGIRIRLKRSAGSRISSENTLNSRKYMTFLSSVSVISHQGKVCQLQQKQDKCKIMIPYKNILIKKK